MAEFEDTKYCPACDRKYKNWEELRVHLQKAVIEGDLNHIDIIELEGWNEIMSSLVGKAILSEEHKT